VSTVLAANATTSRPGSCAHHNNGARARPGPEGGDHTRSATVTQPGTPPPADAASGRRGDATFLRCTGCTAVALLAQREQDYGRLVRGFLNRHEQCGNAVEIRRADSGTASKTTNHSGVTRLRCA
jgi:hypothetical protein